jgi:hypothetical protein
MGLTYFGVVVVITTHTATRYLSLTYLILFANMHLDSH